MTRPNGLNGHWEAYILLPCCHRTAWTRISTNVASSTLLDRLECGIERTILFAEKLVVYGRW